MTAKVTILKPIRTSRFVRSETRLLEINAAVYDQLIPIAARQRLTVQGFVQRLCEGVVELEPLAGEAQFDG